MQRHEERGTLRPGPVDDQRVRPGVQPPYDRGGVPTRHGGPSGAPREQGATGREAGQGLAPEAELGRGERSRIILRAQPLLLPAGEVGVRHRQRRELRRGAGDPGGVGARQVPEERGQGPAVARDVVQHEQQRVLSRPVLDAEQHGVQGKFGGEVEPVPGGFGDGLVQLA